MTEARAPLSVLHIGGGRYRPDDRGHATFAIWRELARGFRRYTVIGRSTAPEAARLEEGNLAVHLLPSRWGSDAEFLLTQFRALPLARELRPDVVVVQCPVLGGLAARRIARETGARVLVEFHGAHFFAEGPRASREGVIRALTPAGLRRAHRIRVLSAGMRDRLGARYGADLLGRTVVLPPRVDLSRFRSVKQDRRIDGRPKVVMVGSVTPRKRQATFLRAVLPALPDLEVWIVGTGPDLPECRAIAERLGATDRVRFWGQVDHATLAGLLPRADALVLFSVSEGTPRAILEGMAAGLPIVTTDAGFCADIVAHGTEGFVLGADPEREVIARLSELLADEGLRARMGEAARRRAEREFDAEVLYDRYRALIRETAA